MEETYEVHRSGCDVVILHSEDEVWEEIGKSWQGYTVTSSSNHDTDQFIPF